METLNLTEQDILNDIEVYQARLDRIRDRLQELLAKGSNVYEGGKVRATRRRLRAEIKHVQGLLAMAREALAECEQEDDIII
jgi:hypothetical protein